jgi:hypothetical protein
VGVVVTLHIYVVFMNIVPFTMQFWSKRLSRLESVRNQLNSVVVLNILHNLEQAHSTYAQAFIHVHRYMYAILTHACLLPGPFSAISVCRTLLNYHSASNSIVSTNFLS